MSQSTNAGIVTDKHSGERHIPESVRADGSKRRAIKIRPGYRPPEDVEVYKNRTAEVFRSRYKGGVIGAETADAGDPDETPSAVSSAAANKNAKRREARKKAKAADQQHDPQSGEDRNGQSATAETKAAKEEDTAKNEGDKKETESAAVGPEAEREKKARNLKKKLKQAKELKDKKEGGQALLPEQIAKVIKINELVRELAALGFDADGERVEKEEADAKEDKEKAPA